jgi:lipoprotein-anchoring transpeptidase ErfK/SrfK
MVKCPCFSGIDAKTAVSSAEDIRISASLGGVPAYLDGPFAASYAEDPDYGGRYVIHGRPALHPSVSHLVLGDGVFGGVAPVA